MKMNFPNKLTTLRLMIAPFFFIFFLYNENWEKFRFSLISELTELYDLFDWINKRQRVKVVYKSENPTLRNILKEEFV